jgi:type III secretion protein U
VSSEKTEQPTAHRLREARKDGQVAKSKDFTQVLMLGALFGYTLAASDDIVREFVALMTAPAKVHGLEFHAALAIVMSQAVHSVVWLFVPYLLIVIVGGILAEASQTGVLFAFKMLVPKGDKLNPVTNLKQIFSMKNIVEFVKSLFKVVLLSLIVAMVIRDALDALVKVPAAGIAAVGQALYELLKTLTIQTFVAYLAIALADFAWQRHSYIKGLMMSMEEIKQEHKQLEGDPHVKGHRKELAKEIAMGEGVKKSAKASVVVTNPTHLAIALFYEEQETALPVVLAKGEGAIAAAMVRVAREAGVPVMQNIPLARALMATAQIDQYIPSELIEPVAEVLRAIRRLAEGREEEDTP